MEQRPHFGEIVTVRSWPRNWHKLFAVRDYDILDKDGKAMVRGRSGWLIVDVEKRRPLRPQAAMEQLPRNEGINALPLGASGGDAPSALADRFAGSGINPPNTGDAGTIRRVSYSDIDFNGHMNNTRYIQWIQDLFEPEILEDARQLRLDINYLSEALYGQELNLVRAPFTDSAEPGEGPVENPADYPAKPAAAFAIEGRREGQAVFRAELRTGK
jgi:acyl-CoA thioesterase FadM